MAMAFAATFLVDVLEYRDAPHALAAQGDDEVLVEHLRHQAADVPCHDAARDKRQRYCW